MSVESDHEHQYDRSELRKRFVRLSQLDPSERAASEDNSGKKLTDDRGLVQTVKDLAA